MHRQSKNKSYINNKTHGKGTTHTQSHSSLKLRNGMDSTTRTGNESCIVFFCVLFFFFVASDSEQESSTFNKDSAIDIRPVTVLCHIFFLSLFFLHFLSVYQRNKPLRILREHSKSL